MSNYRDFINFSETDDMHNLELSQQPLYEIQMQLTSKQELRFRYIQLMNDAEKILGREEAVNLIKESKVIYLVYLEYNTKINNFYEFKTLNMFQKKHYNDPENQDLYKAIYDYHKCTDLKNYKIFFDENNYIETSINTIFYYLIGINC